MDSLVSTHKDCNLQDPPINDVHELHISLSLSQERERERERERENMFLISGSSCTANSSAPHCKENIPQSNIHTWSGDKPLAPHIQDLNVSLIFVFMVSLSSQTRSLVSETQ